MGISIESVDGRRSPEWTLVNRYATSGLKGGARVARALEPRLSRHSRAEVVMSDCLATTFQLVDYMQRRLVLGTYERAEALLAEALLRPGDHAVDVGANVGWFTAMFSRAVGTSGSVTALEPDPAIYHRLSKDIERSAITNVVVLNVAATAEHGRFNLWQSREANRGSNTLVDEATSGTVEVVGVPLDDVLHDVERIRFIKIDVEGHELSVLCGARELLASDRLDAVMIELNPELWDHRDAERLLDEDGSRWDWRRIVLRTSGVRSSLGLIPLTRDDVAGDATESVRNAVGFRRAAFSEAQIDALCGAPPSLFRRR